MQNQVTIKDFNNFEVGELYAIMRHIYLTSGFMSDDFDEKFPSIGFFKTYFSNLLKRNGSFILIAIFDDKPVGYIVLETNAATRLQHTAWLNMGVVDIFRGKGIGQQLLDAAINKAFNDRKIEIVYLMVRSDHFGAVRLYKKAGFDQIALLEKDTKIGDEYFDGILMRKFIK